MNLKYALLTGIALLLGFLFYPRSTTKYSINQPLISPARTLDSEPLRLTELVRSNPPYSTFDLGYIYKIDTAQVVFDNPEDSGPRQFDILVKNQLSRRYKRIHSFIGNSREYGYPLQSFQTQTEARWVQVVINDWFTNKPQLQKDRFRVGTRYKQHGPIKGATATHNTEFLFRLTDLLPNTKWAAADVIIDNKGTENASVAPAFRKPTLNGQVATVVVKIDLGRRQNIYGTRVTTGGAGNNLKRYSLEIGGRSAITQRNTEINDFIPYYKSEILANEVVKDTYLPETSERGRFIKLKIDANDWYGEYAEVRNFEVFTDDYRILSSQSPFDPQYRNFEDYATRRVEYENLGANNNQYAPHLKQGFAYDKEAGDFENRYLLPQTVSESDTPNSITSGDLVDQHSFAYHYDTVEIHFGAMRPMNPRMLYWIQVAYLQNSDGKRIQNLLADQFLLHSALEIPTNAAQTYTFQIPTQAYASGPTVGEVTLRFNRLAGANAVVSTVSLLESSPLRDDNSVNRKDSQKIHLLTNQKQGRSIRTDNIIKIDGLVNDWHLLYSLVPMFTGQKDKLLPTQYQSRNESPVHLYTQWDDDNLYILLNFNQPEDEKNQLINQHHRLHLFIDTQRTASPGMYTPTDHHFIFDLSNFTNPEPEVYVSQVHHHLDAIPATINNYKDISVALRLVSFTNSDSNIKEGYTVEIQLPKQLVLNQFKTGVGYLFGLNYILNRTDLEKNKNLSSFAFTSSDSNSSPQNWFPIEMVSRVSAEVDIMSQRGLESIDKLVVGDTISLCVWDADRNSDPTLEESITVQLKNNRSEVSSILKLPEVDYASFVDDNLKQNRSSNSSFFAAKILTEFDEAIPSNNTNTLTKSLLKVRGGDEIVLTYTDPYFGYNQRNKIIKKAAIVKKGYDGRVYFGTFNGEELVQISIGSELFVFIEDIDLQENLVKTVPLELNILTTAPEPSHQSLQREMVTATLAEDLTSEGKMLYRGHIPSTYQPVGVSLDNQLQLAGGQVIEATYLDLLQSTGQTDVCVKTQLAIKTGETAKLEIIGNGKILSGESFQIRLIDKDLNTSPNEANFATVEISTNRLPSSERSWFEWPLSETNLSSSVFTASCPTVFRSPSFSPEVNREKIHSIPISGGEKITVRYLDEHQSSGQTKQMITESVLVESGDDGVLTITGEDYTSVVDQFRAGTSLHFLLQDADLIDSSVAIDVIDQIGGDKEKVILNRQLGRANFAGKIPTEFWNKSETKSDQPVANDGTLKVQGDSIIQATYKDKLQSTGETKIDVSVQSRVMHGRTGKLSAYTISKMPSADTRPEIIGRILEAPVTHFRAGQAIILEVLDDDLLDALRVPNDLDIESISVVEIDTSRDQVRDRLVLPLEDAISVNKAIRWVIQTQYSTIGTPEDQVLQVQGGGIMSVNYVDDLQANGATGVPINLELSVDIGTTGHLSIYRQNIGTPISNDKNAFVGFEIGEDLRIVLEDDDLNILDQDTETTSVLITSPTSKAQLDLSEVSAGIFVGSLKTNYLTADNVSRGTKSDSILTLQSGQVVTIQYIDNLTQTGQTDVVLSRTIIALSGRKGKIRIVSMDNIKKNEATEIASFRAGDVLGVWLEDDLPKKKYASTDEVIRVPVTIHSRETQDKITINLKPLKKNDGVYIGHFATRYSIAPIVDHILDVKGGETVVVTHNPLLLGNTAIEDQVLVEKGRRAHLELVTEYGGPIQNFNVGDSLYFRLEDPDLNEDGQMIDQIIANVLVDGNEAFSQFVITRESSSSSRFVGQVDTFYGRVVTPSSKVKSLYVLPLIGGEVVTVQYLDPLTETGATNIPVTFSCRSNLHAFAQYTENHIVIDGVNDNWPLENTLRTDNDTILLWFQWDHEALYFLAQIRDESVEVKDPLTYFRGSDALELHLDLAPEKVKKPFYLQKQIHSKSLAESHNQANMSELNSRYIFWFCPKGAGFDGQKPYVGQAQPRLIPNYQAKGLQFAVRYNQPADKNNSQQYYIIEGRIPFFPLLPQFDPLKTKRNLRLGFNFVLYRSDNQAIHWAQPVTGMENIFPSDLGLLVLLP